MKVNPGKIGLVMLVVICLVALVDLHLYRATKNIEQLENELKSYRGMTFDEIVRQGMFIGSLKTVDILSKREKSSSNTTPSE